MGAHLRAVDRPRCYSCQAPATKELRSTSNAVLGYYCGRHAQPALSAQIRVEVAAFVEEG